MPRFRLFAIPGRKNIRREESRMIALQNRADGAQRREIRSGRVFTPRAVQAQQKGEDDVRLGRRLSERPYPSECGSTGPLEKPPRNKPTQALSPAFAIRVHDVHLHEIGTRQAAKLLDGPLAVKEVAAAVGYPSASEFDRHFRATFGITPSAYRAIMLMPRPDASHQAKIDLHPNRQN